MPQVLVIDDESFILDLLQSILIQFGYDVKVACDGREGIEVFNAENDLDLVITDIRMPGMDGNAVARHIRNSDRPHMPIIAITAFSDKFESDLFDFFITKPFDIQTLADAIETLK